MKDPKNMTTDELIELADKIKRGMTTNFLEDAVKIRKADKMINKKIITKRESIMIADSVKSGMSLDVLNDLRELKTARFKLLKAV